MTLLGLIALIAFSVFVIFFFPWCYWFGSHYTKRTKERFWKYVWVWIGILIATAMLVFLGIQADKVQL